MKVTPKEGRLEFFDVTMNDQNGELYLLRDVIEAVEVEISEEAHVSWMIHIKFTDELVKIYGTSQSDGKKWVKFFKKVTTKNKFYHT